MIIINTISDKVFSLNGVNYAKIYQPLKQGVQAIGIYNIYDTRQQLISSTDFNEFKIDGAVYATQEETIAAILDVTFELELTGTVTALLESKTDKGGYSGTSKDLYDLINGSTSGFQGDLAVADTPASDGYYFASQTGTYSNAGGLVVDLANGLSIILVSGGVTVFEQIVVPLSSSNFVEFSDIEGLQSRAIDAIANASNVVPLTVEDVSTIAGVILLANGSVSASGSHKTTDFLENTDSSDYNYYLVDFEKYNDTGYANLVYYDESNNFLKDFLMLGRKVVGVPPKMSVKISTTNSKKIQKVLTKKFVTDLSDGVKELEVVNYKNWVDESVSSGLGNTEAVQMLEAVKVFHLDVDASKENNTFTVNTFCTNPTSLNSNYAFIMQIKDGSESVYFDLKSTFSKNGIDILTGKSSDGLRSGVVVVDWSLLPDTYQFYGQSSVRIKTNSYNAIASLAKDVHDLKVLSSLGGDEKKILIIGTSITQGSSYPLNASAACGYTAYNKGIGSSGICLNTGVLGNGRDGLDLAETIAEKEARYSGTVTSETMEIYRNASWERVIKPYLDGTIDEVDAILFDHGYNDRNQIYLELPAIDAIDWTLTGVQDRSKFSGAFKYLMNEIFKINPYCKVIIGGYLEGESDNSKRGGEGIKQMHEAISKAYGFPFLRVFDYTGFSFKSVPNTSTFISDYNTENSTSYGVYFPDAYGNVTFFQLYMPDTVHPYSDKSGKTNELLDAIYTKLLKDIL